MTHTVMCAEGHVCHGAPPGGMLQILAELPITTKGAIYDTGKILPAVQSTQIWETKGHIMRFRTNFRRLSKAKVKSC